MTSMVIIPWCMIDCTDGTISQSRKRQLVRGKYVHAPKELDTSHCGGAMEFRKVCIIYRSYVGVPPNIHILVLIVWDKNYDNVLERFCLDCPFEFWLPPKVVQLLYYRQALSSDAAGWVFFATIHSIMLSTVNYQPKKSWKLQFRFLSLLFLTCVPSNCWFFQKLQV